MPEPLHDRIRQQYASEQGRPFYRAVMGAGGFDIHYGLYADESTTMQDATRAATDRLLELAKRGQSSTAWGRLLDLGSGRGGPAHRLANACECLVTCVDLCAEHHEENLQQAAKAGVGDRIETWLGSFEDLPAEWGSRFDAVWGQESFCHAADVHRLLREVHRVLRSGGVLAFSDIMIEQSACASDLSAFAGVNAIMKLTTQDSYARLLDQTGFIEVKMEDWTDHLERNFREMLANINLHHAELVQSGVDAQYLTDFATSLESRIKWVRGSVLHWGAFTAIRSEG